MRLSLFCTLLLVFSLSGCMHSIHRLRGPVCNQQLASVPVTANQ